jgi:tRNA A-37 threonylcarbamoyl transferase component Bud32
MEEIHTDLHNGLAGRYVVERELGRGGMATVYLARDVKHDRKVAIKVLHADLAAALGPERFLQEIRVTAALQHPHVLALIDSGLFGTEAGALQGRPYYVMPFVNGESLRHRLEREQQLPVADAVRIASEVASALDYAHRQGVVHRDIKPENILLHDGSALVADFGIALAVTTAGTQRMTQTGLSLGTPQYMSPEQAMGEKTITARSDIWALGAVTYEMLSGEPPFTGPTVQAIVARLMSEDPRSLTAQRRSIPPHVNDAVLRALDKVPADRWATAADFGAALNSASAVGVTTATPFARHAGGIHRRERVILWTVIAAASLAAAWALVRPKGAPPQPALRAELTLGDSAGVGVLAVVPGDSLIIIGGQVADRPLSLARLATGERTPLRGTEGSTVVAPSPDGRSIAFVARGQLWRMLLPDGAAVPIAAVRNVFTAEWSTDDHIALTEERGMVVTVVPATGGAKDTLPRVSQTQVIGIASFSRGRWLLSSPTGMWMVEGRRARRLTRNGLVDSATAADTAGAPAGIAVHLLAAGYLAWVTPSVHGPPGQHLMVASIDARSGRLTGPAVSLVDTVTAPLRFGTGGLLLYARGSGDAPRVMVIADRTGRRDTLPLPPAVYETFDVTPDGRRIVVGLGDNVTSELRLFNGRSSASRVLFTTPYVLPFEPRFTPDGRRLAVILLRFAPGSLSQTASTLVLLDPDDTRRIDTLYRGSFIPQSWSPDGRELAGAVETGPPPSPELLGRFAPRVDTVPRLVQRTFGNAVNQTFAPDGRWYAFSSSAPAAEQSGIYVTENRDGAVASRIADARFMEPKWTSDGREIIVLERRTFQFYSIPVRAGSPPAFSPPVPLFRADRLAQLGGMSYRVLRDGRFVFLETTPRAPVRTLTVLTDWRAEYARRTAALRK